MFFLFLIFSLSNYGTLIQLLNDYWAKIKTFYLFKAIASIGKKQLSICQLYCLVNKLAIASLLSMHSLKAIYMLIHYYI